MSASWSFYIQRSTDPVHNPISGEFFSTEAVGSVTEALVREAIQNTLDARVTNVDGSRQHARARLYLSEDAGSLSSSQAKRWFESIWPHVLAPGNGLRDIPSQTERCPFLVFEDLGTIGLEGDTTEHQIRPRITNHFLNFFRAEGHSDKAEHDRGSWGVGKTVFPRSSRINSFFGLTVRHSDRQELLLGRSILKYHRAAEQAYKSDGYYGTSREDGFVLPLEDAATLAEFRQNFRLKRRTESGLSIVVPWYENDGDDAITREAVLTAVLHGFFYPILMSHLSVEIAGPSYEIPLDAQTLVGSVQAMPGPLRASLLPLIELTEWARTRLPSEFLSLDAPSPDRSQQWSSELIPASILQDIRLALAHRQRVAIRVPLHVQSKGGAPESTHFQVFLEHSDEDLERPVFIRDELIITDVKAKRVAKVRSLVIVEDKPLATLLRDAETPAHTQWNQGTGNFKNKYRFGSGVIRFVTDSVSQIVQAVSAIENEPDPSLTIDFFSIPSEPDDDEVIEARRRVTSKPDGPNPPPPPPPPPPPRPRRFRIAKLMGGFSIRPGDPEAVLPSLIQVKVAYDVRKGNPLRKYNEADFEIGTKPIQCDASGAKIVSAEANYLLFEVLGPEFNVQVTGFDADRDLYVRATAKEELDVD